MSPNKISPQHKSEIQEEKGWVKKLMGSVRRKTDAVMKMIFTKHEPLFPVDTSYLDTRPFQDDDFPEFDHVGSIQDAMKYVPDIQPDNAPRAEVVHINKSIAPKLIVDNSVPSVDRFEPENAIQDRMEREGFRILFKMQQANTVEELVGCVTKDFVEAVRRVEEIASIRAGERINLIGPRGITVTVTAAVTDKKDKYAEYRYLSKELKRLCNFFPNPGGRIKNSYEGYVGYRQPEYSDIQVIFDVDATTSEKTPTNIHDTVFSGKGSYRNLLGAHLVPMTETFARRLEEIKEVYYDMYHDPLTGLLNQTSYYEAVARLKELGMPFRSYFFEILNDNPTTIALEHHGNEAIMKGVAEGVGRNNSRRTFFFEDPNVKINDPARSFIVSLDITDGPEFERMARATAAKLNTTPRGFPFPIKNIILTRPKPDGTPEILE